MTQNNFSQEELGAFLTGLAHLVKAGLNNGDALSLLAQDEENTGRKALLESMAEQADNGNYLSDIFRDAGCFPAYTVAMTRTGEDTGRLEEALFALADYYDSRARMERRMKTALFQPMALLGVLTVVVIALLGWVLPVFDDVYRQLGTGLSGFAAFLLSVGKVIRMGAPVLLILMAVGGAFTYKALKGKQLHFAGADEAWLAQVLALALSSGLTPDSAMELAGGLGEAGSDFGEKCKACVNDIQEGETLPAVLAKHGLMPKADCRLLDAGLRSGCGDSVMAQLAEKASERSENAIEAKLSRIEPALVTGASLLVGLILLTVLLPLTRIMAAMG